MPRYLFYGSYTPEGYKGLMQEQDLYIIVNLPDNIATAAVTLAGNVSGTFSIKCVALLTAAELD